MHEPMAGCISFLAVGVAVIRPGIVSQQQGYEGLISDESA
jgi:hypothetical protein